MNKKRKYPKVVETELGEADVGFVKGGNAHRSYLCPICDEDIEIGESHLVIVPKVIERLRRHVHLDCPQTQIDYGLRITLHPNEPQIETYYF